MSVASTNTFDGSDKEVTPKGALVLVLGPSGKGTARNRIYTRRGTPLISSLWSLRQHLYGRKDDSNKSTCRLSLTER